MISSMKLRRPAFGLLKLLISYACMFTEREHAADNNRPRFSLYR